MSNITHDEELWAFLSASNCNVSLSADDGVEANNGPGAYRVSGAALVGRQFLALFVKRFHYVRRSKKAFLSQASWFDLVLSFLNYFLIINVFAEFVEGGLMAYL